MIKVWALVECSYRCLVVVRIDDGLVVDIVLMRVAIDGKLTQALKPLWCQLIVGEETQCGSKNIDKLQRITGYLVGTTDRWNSGKLAELHDRVTHIDHGMQDMFGSEE